MKKTGILVGLSLCFFASSYAYALEQVEKNHLIYQPDALLHICNGLFGCADRISIDAQEAPLSLLGFPTQFATQQVEVLLEPLGFAKQEIADIRSCLTDSGVYDVGPGQVVGFMVKEKGHFPNPTVEVTVFKMLDTEIPPPCP
jgi:hypothetical protein